MVGVIEALVLAVVAPPPPPVVTVTVPPVRTPAPSAASSERRMVLWMPEAATCAGGGDPRPVSIRRPYNQLIWGTGAQAAPITFSFAIDASGRPHSIALKGSENARSDQFAPALATSRFAPGSAHSDCSLTYRPVAQPLDAVDRAELASYTMTGQSPRLPREGYERLHAGDECRMDTQPLRRVYPDFDDIAATPGVRDWALLGFGVSPKGQPENVKLLTGTGNAALDAAGVKALKESRFNAGERRRGCTYPYWRAAAPLPAPPLPPRQSEPAEPCCDTRWANAPQLAFPESYRSRSIEGWAILTYDVAPWGAIGNVAVVEAQPTMDFGLAAKTMLERATKPAGSAAEGCRTVVIYRLPDSSEPMDDSAVDQG